MKPEVRKCTGPDCGRDIVFAMTDAGKRMPLDARPQLGFLVDPHPTLEGEFLAKSIHVYVPHWSTCPNAEQFRARRRSD